MNLRRLTIYGNWSSYDELSDSVPLTEELAMRQMDEILRLRRFGVRIDAYLMDAFWFARDGGYRTWKKPNWPNGPDRWFEACREHGLLPGLWFTANTLCQLDLPEAWRDSSAGDNWGLCCFHGGFLADYLDVLHHWYERGIRIFKIDFADFSAAPPDLKASFSPDQIRAKNITAFREGLASFRIRHPDAILMAFNGFESASYMERTDIFPANVVDLAWLDVFDSIYPGDPRPADIRTIPFWRSVDIYSDHVTRVLHSGGVPLSRIDNTGFMAGETGTCYRRGKAGWKAMFLLALMRGGDLTVLYGDLGLFSDEDASWMAAAQRLIEPHIAQGAQTFGGLPGREEVYGWSAGDLLIVVNPGLEEQEIGLPDGSWKVVFSESGDSGCLLLGVISLGPSQAALLSRNPKVVDLSPRDPYPTMARVDVANSRLDSDAFEGLAHVEAGEYRLFAQQFDASGNLVRTWPSGSPGEVSMTELIRLSVELDGAPLEFHPVHDRWVWSGMSWGGGEFHVPSEGRLRIVAKSGDANTVRVGLSLYKVVGTW